MNREHLYRGKNDDGEWVYGNLIETKEEYSDEIVYAILEKTAEHRCCGEYCDDGWHSVVKETIGEFTGLTDKNGNKIFEVDIVCLNKICELYVVQWNKTQCRFSLYQGGTYEQSGFNEDTMKNYEIIGNIHDNPELLTKKA